MFSAILYSSVLVSQDLMSSVENVISSLENIFDVVGKAVQLFHSQ